MFLKSGHIRHKDSKFYKERGKWLFVFLKSLLPTLPIHPTQCAAPKPQMRKGATKHAGPGMNTDDNPCVPSRREEWLAWVICSREQAWIMIRRQNWTTVRVLCCLSLQHPGWFVQEWLWNSFLLNCSLPSPHHFNHLFTRSWKFSVLLFHYDQKKNV